jgi:DNA-binding transcriptional ArsR family regulator
LKGQLARVREDWVDELEKAAVLEVMTALSSPVRLDAYRLLVPRGAAGMVAGEIATALGQPLTNMSFHLKALTQSGLATVAQEGRYQRYRANIPRMLDVIAFLTENCCANDPAQCRQYRDQVPAVAALLPPLTPRPAPPARTRRMTAAGRRRRR